MNPIPSYPVQDDDPDALAYLDAEFPYNTRGGRRHRAVRCRECMYPDDQQVRDFDDGRTWCSICGKFSGEKFNETGLMFR